MSFPMICSTEAVAQRCSVKKVFLEISQNLQENTCARVSFLINAGVLVGTLLSTWIQMTYNNKKLSYIL